jgi:hypothetical protein
MLIFRVGPRIGGLQFPVMFLWLLGSWDGVQFWGWIDVLRERSALARFLGGFQA